MRDMKVMHLHLVVTFSLHQLHLGKRWPVNSQALALRASRKQVCGTVVSLVENTEEY